MLPIRIWRSTNVDADREFARRALGVDIAAKHGLASELCLVAKWQVVSPSILRRKSDAKYESLVLLPRELLSLFGTEDWVATNESKFTKYVEGWTAFRAEVGDLGDKPNLKRADQWISGLLVGKHLSKGHREYLKANGKHGKLYELPPPSHTHMLCFSKFLLGRSFSLSISL